MHICAQVSVCVLGMISDTDEESKAASEIQPYNL